MATDDHTSLTEGNEVEQHEKLTAHLKLPSTIEQFVQDCRNIGQTAVAVDGHFKTVKAGLADLVRKYGRDFPGIQGVYVPKWNSFMARWDGENGLLWSSRAFASKTVVALKGKSFPLKSHFDLLLTVRLYRLRGKPSTHLDQRD
ncbi:hypothetical protein Agabi119p4_9644 [Agaricus bisporus var. burnettii]|uniref:Uncharacterized protein n=1 Tax=Agaricus bisporus var. burnettii TaxID=192524 RepID=A0A8H7EX81_AGABI|nr:hypothetical protein Agabi119p4_9644 [Agaricus bisporus var. burnettii]